MAIYKPPDDLSSDNYQALLDTFRSGRFVSFIGAGASMPTGIPAWEKMLQRLIALKGLRFRVSDYEGRYPELASAIYARYEELSCEQEYYDYLVSMSEPTECYCTSLHHALIDAVPVHVTTNFDCVLELAYERYKRETTPLCQYFPHFDVDQLDDHSIVYLHANRNERRFVFRKEEFDQYYPSVSRADGSLQIEFLLRHLFERRHMLFIGFSFYNDPYLKGCIAAISKQITYETQIEAHSFGRSLRPADISHYALLHVSESEPVHVFENRSRLIEELQEYQIHAICYRRHREVEDILLELRRLKDMGEAGSDEQAWAVNDREEENVL